jgi:hypothetical protein
MSGRLLGRSYAVLYLGDKDDAARRGVEDALDAGGAGPPARSVTLTLPFDPQALMGLVHGDQTFSTLANVGAVGRELGLQYANGGDSLWSVVRGELVQESSGPFGSPVDGVVVVSNWRPDGAGDAASARNDAAQQLLAGMLEGLQSSGLKVVGVESFKGDGQPSTLGGFEGLSTVNDVDLLPGTVALGMLLATNTTGHFGVSAPDGVIPNLNPLIVAQAPVGAG